jgi:leucyl-tRNA---protein transferase
MEDFIFFLNTQNNTINDVFFADRLSLQKWDEMLARGWRHNGLMVFRLSIDLDDNGIPCPVIPLRYDLKDFEFSKSQRIILKRNQDLTHVFRPTKIDDEKHELFFNHAKKYRSNQPDSLFEFISTDPKRPFKTWELCVYKADKLVACSFMDITPHAISSTYAMYDLSESKRSLGIFTMLLELEYAMSKRKKYYYPGYAFEQPSFYDYKKKFKNVEFYNWKNEIWQPLKLKNESKLSNFFNPQFQKK